MRIHIDNLIQMIPDLLKRKIVDIGSGKGSFLIELAKRGVSAIGIEPTPEYIALSLATGRKSGYALEVIQGTAEHIPLPDSSVDFANMSEIIEHVENPGQVLVEAYRILRPGGRGYLSAPNRFGFRDQHFHLHVINWMPRTWAHAVIGLRRRHKDYSGKTGRQSLLEMHYYTYATIKKLCWRTGFIVSDIRIEKIKRTYGTLASFLIPIYMLLRVFYWDAFHLLLEKK